MKPFTSEKEYAEKWRKVGLSASARERIENQLMDYARFHQAPEGESGTVRVGEESRSIKRIPQSGILSFIQLSNWKLKPMTALILIALLAGGSTSFAAEHAVPGDALYGMKVEMNEEVKSIFAVSNEAEAKLQLHLLQERIKEAGTLAARGELTVEAATDLSARMKEHVNEAEKRSEEIEAEGDAETATSVRISLETTLRSGIAVVGVFNGSGENTGVVSLTNDLGEMLVSNAKSYSDSSAHTDIQIEAGAQISIASTTVTRAESEFNAVKVKFSTIARQNIEARLEEAVTAYAQAKVAFRDGAYETAYRAAEIAISIGTEVQSMVQNTLRADIYLDTPVNSVLKVNSENSQVDAEANVEVDADASVDTDIIDTNIETDSRVGSTVQGTLGL